MTKNHFTDTFTWFWSLSRTITNVLLMKYAILIFIVRYQKFTELINLPQLM